jgi:hypothetical protein
VQKDNISIVIVRKRKNPKSKKVIFFNEKPTEKPSSENYQNFDGILSFCLGKSEPIELKFLWCIIPCITNNILKNQPNLKCDSIVSVI